MQGTRCSILGFYIAYLDTGALEVVHIVSAQTVPWPSTWTCQRRSSRESSCTAPPTMWSLDIDFELSLTCEITNISLSGEDMNEPFCLQGLHDSCSCGPVPYIHFQLPSSYIPIVSGLVRFVWKSFATQHVSAPPRSLRFLPVGMSLVEYLRLYSNVWWRSRVAGAFGSSEERG